MNVKRSRRYWIGLALVALLLLPLLVGAAPAPAPAEQEEYAPGRVLVKFQDSVDEGRKGQIHRANGGKKLDEIEGLGWEIIEVAAGKEKDAVARYKKNAGVQEAEPDYIIYTMDTPNDSHFPTQWALHNNAQSGGVADADMDLPEAWALQKGSPGIIIAILDTGIDQDHPDLAARIIGNMNFSSSGTVDDLFGHGTHCAGIAAAATNNAVGVAGVAWNASLLNAKVLDDAGSGYYSSVASGIRWAADSGAKVISMSLGGSAGSTVLQEAVNYAWKKGAIIVAAAGNNASSAPCYPAYYSNCIAVASTNSRDERSYFSNYGKWVDVAAPGESIYSTLPNHANRLGATLNYGYLSGTSMATPQVAGLAALVWSTSSGTSNKTVRSRIEGSCDSVVGSGFFWAKGRVNACKAVGGNCAYTPGK